MRTCEKCGAPLPMQSGRGRRRKMCQTCAPSRDRGKSKPAVAPLVREGYDSVLSSVTAELTDVGMLNSHQGQIAVGLARRFDAGDDTGAAMAQVARQLRETMASALASKEPVEVNPLDELRAKRERRVSGS